MLRRVPLLAVLIMLWCQPAFAQMDIMGVWRPLPRNQDGSGMTGDIAGVPVSDAARGRVQSWSPEDSTSPSGHAVRTPGTTRSKGRSPRSASGPTSIRRRRR
jgi:hypothetical protein